MAVSGMMGATFFSEGFMKILMKLMAKGGTVIFQLVCCVAVSAMVATAVVIAGFAIAALRWLLT